MSKEDKLKKGEAKYVATVRLRLNYGKLEVEPSQVVVMGNDDRAQGINIKTLIMTGAIVPYENEAQVKAIKEHYEAVDRLRRDEIKRMNRRHSRQREA